MLTTAIRPVVIALFSFFIVQSAAAQQTAKELNYVHDKMVLLMQQSEKVELPASVITNVQEINKNEEHKEKISRGQLSLLRVIYNPALKKEDIKFFSDQILNNNSSIMTAIQPLVRKKLAE